MRRKKLKITIIVLVLLLIALILVRVIAGYVMQWRVDGRLAELRERGEPVSLAELAPEDVPDEENGALVYLEALKQLEPLPDDLLHRASRLLKEGRVVPPDEVPKARRILSEAADVLRLLRDGARLSKCRYAIDYTISLEQVVIFPAGIGRFYQAVRLLLLSARVNLAEGKADEAVEDCVALLKFGLSSRSEPIMLSMLKEVGCTMDALRQIEAVMDRAGPSEESLRAVLRALADTDDRERLALVMRGERCWGLAYGTLLLDHPVETLKHFSMEGVGPGTRIRTFLLRPYIQMDHLRYLDIMDKWVALAADLPDSWRPTGPSALMMDAGPWNRPLSDNLDRSMEGSVSAFLRGRTHRRLARLAIALRLHRMKLGKYAAGTAELVPEFLDKALVDPFSGKDFIYRREGKGFILYSVGLNGADDGGTEDPENRDAGDIVWKCSR